MKQSTNRLLLLFGGILAVGTPPAVFAETTPNPYQVIVERNPFGLKPPPPPPDVTPVAPATPPGKVILTGITTLFGSPRALLEITEQEAGKGPTVRKPILHEGDRDGAIEIVSIDVEKSLVKIRNAGTETNISFETPKLAGGAPAPAPGGFLPTPLTTAMAGTPAIFSPASAAANDSGRSSMTVFGSPGSAAGVSSLGRTAGAYGGAGSIGTPAYGGYGAGTAVAGTPNTANTGFTPIPSRTLRTDAPAAPTAPTPSGPPVDTAQQYLNMALQHQLHTSKGLPFPPLPPMPE